MKGRETIEAQAHSAAPRTAVWQVIADVPGWSRWGAWRSSELEREGEPPAGGVGAVKVLTSENRRPVVSREEVTVFEPPSRFGYRLLSGLPLRDYNATITLTEASDGGTDIVWRSQFEPKYPLTGGMFRRGLGKFIREAAQRLAREAEAANRPPEPA